MGVAGSGDGVKRKSIVSMISVNFRLYGTCIHNEEKEGSKNVSVFRNLRIALVLLAGFVVCQPLTAKEADSRSSFYKYLMQYPWLKRNQRPISEFIIEIPERVVRETNGRVTVGFLADTHGNFDMTHTALRQLILERKAHFVVMNGDLTHSGPRALKKILQMATDFYEQLGLSPEEARARVLVKPGNREHRNGMLPERANQIMSDFATLISDSDIEPVNLIFRTPQGSSENSRKFFINHFLLDRPETEARRVGVYHGFKELKNSIAFLNLVDPRRWPKSNRLPSTFNQMNRKIRPDNDTELVNVQHTHKTFVIPVLKQDGTEVMAFNTGAISSEEGDNPLDNGNRYADQPYGYGTYTFTVGQPGGLLRLYDASQDIKVDLFEYKNFDKPIPCQRITSSMSRPLSPNTVDQTVVQP